MPTIDIPDKICTHCGGTRWNFTEHRRQYICALRLTERARKAYLANPESYKKRAKESAQRLKNNPETKEKRKIYKKKWRNDNADKSARYRKATSDKERNNLKDDYLKKLIAQYTELSFTDIPQPLIELKRKQLLLKRKIKNNGNKS